MKSQTYKTFSITLLLKYYLFGEDFDKVRNEVRKQTKNITLLHFSSMQRMQEIFTVEEQIGTSFQYEHDDFDATRTCGGKVSVVDSNGKKGVGFILEERRNFWKIKLKNTSEVCYLKKLLYNKQNEMYDFNGFHDYQGRTISSYWPIRILLSKSGSCRMTINRFSYKTERPNNILTAPMFTS